MFNDNGGRGGQAVYNALGLKAPEKIEQDVIKKGEMKQLSQEVIPEYAADYMFITDYNPKGKAKHSTSWSIPLFGKILTLLNIIACLSMTLTRSTRTTRFLSANRWISSPTC